MRGMIKKQVILTVTIALWILLAVCSGEAQLQTQKVALDNAIEQGLVYVEFQGMGASTGDSILMKITNLTTKSLEVVIMIGTVLKSATAGYQDMIVERVRGIPKGGDLFQPDERILLTAKATVEYVLLAYCLNLDQANPEPHTRFTVRRAEYPEVQKLFAILPQAPPQQRTIQAIQIAIWVITENLTRQQLESRFPATEADITTARELLQRSGIETSSKRLFRLDTRNDR